MSKVYAEPRWDLKGKPIPGPAITLLADDVLLLSAEHCGNLPECYACHRTIAREEQYYSFRAEYVVAQDTGDVMRDYLYGGTKNAARAGICIQCYGKGVL